MDVPLEDVSAVIRIVREVCDRWDDPKAWREHVLHGMRQLVNGYSGSLLADYGHQAGWFGNVAVVATVGLTDSTKALTSISRATN
jgi:hypothetical protein